MSRGLKSVGIEYLLCISGNNGGHSAFAVITDPVAGLRGYQRRNGGGARPLGIPTSHML
jgi:hypothetical protein